MNNEDVFDIKLLPCPFCGSRASYHIHDVYYFDGDAEKFFVMCDKCHARSDAAIVMDAAEGYLAARLWWNKRHTTNDNKE